MFESAIDAAVVRLVAALQALREAPPNLLVQHADALNVARQTIDQIIIDAAKSRTLGGTRH
jgi:hypothetical protein